MGTHVSHTSNCLPSVDLVALFWGVPECAETMTRAQTFELVLLAALWGSSYLFLRLGVPEFGIFALVFVRVAGGALVLLPALLIRGEGPALRQHGWRTGALGLLNSGLPFLCYVVAAKVLAAGTMAVFNATTPIWTAVIAWLWWGERLNRWRYLGLVLGLAGAVGLAWDQIGLAADSATAAAPANAGQAAAEVLPIWVGVLACCTAPVLYGISACMSRQWMSQVPAIAAAMGSQIGPALLLLVPAWLTWPAVNPSATAWWAATGLAVLGTGLAYLLYFRLMVSVGPTKASAVTFLIPAFAMLWGWLALGEQPSLGTLVACGVILVGTALSSGLMGQPAASASAAAKNTTAG